MFSTYQYPSGTAKVGNENHQDFETQQTTSTLVFKRHIESRNVNSMLCQEEEQMKQDACIANEEKGAILKEAKRVHQE